VAEAKKNRKLNKGLKGTLDGIDWLLLFCAFGEVVWLTGLLLVLAAYINYIFYYLVGNGK